MEPLNHRVNLNIQSPLPYKSDYLSSDLGVNVYLKHEDFASSVGITSKLRKLEYLLFRQEISSSTVFISVGSLPSSQNVAVAYAAKRLGIKSHIIYGGETTLKPNNKTGNYYLASQFASAETWYNGENWAEYTNWIEEVEKAEMAAGNTPIIFGPGLSHWPGLLGYTRLGKELNNYFQKNGQKIDFIICPVGSGGVFAGLALSNNFVETPVKIIGVTFAQNTRSAKEAVLRLSDDIVKNMNYNIDNASYGDIVDGTLGVKYGLMNQEMISMSDDILINEGLLLDSVYTLKTYIALKKMVQNGLIPANSNVLLLLTGTCYNEIGGLLKN